MAAETIKGKLYARDALTMPGRAVLLEAQLVHDGLFRQAGIGGEQLEFLVDGRKVGQTMTGGDGRAFIEYVPRMRGTHLVTVKPADPTRIQSSEATAILASWERRRPILLVEMETLFEEAPAPVLPLPSLPGLPGPPLVRVPAPGAADELKRLADFYFNVIYLTRKAASTDPGELEDSREWLRKHGFPQGLTVGLPAGPAALASKIEQMRADGWDNLKAGVGRTRDFAEVLLEHRMRVVIVPEPERGDFPRKVKMAKDWREVRQRLQQ